MKIVEPSNSAGGSAVKSAGALHETVAFFENSLNRRRYRYRADERPSCQRNKPLGCCPQECSGSSGSPGSNETEKKATSSELCAERECSGLMRMFLSIPQISTVLRLTLQIKG